MIGNSPEGSYASRFKKWYREKFVKNQKIRVEKNENLKGCDKYSRGKFLDRKSVGVGKECRSRWWAEDCGRKRKRSRER